MKFQYIGNPRKDGEGPMQVEIRGYRFTKNGEPVEVTDAVAMAKFIRNDHFLHDPNDVRALAVAQAVVVGAANPPIRQSANSPDVSAPKRAYTRRAK